MVVVPAALLLMEDVESLPAYTLQAEIALSGHNWQTTARREAEYFHAHDFFDTRTLLRLWTTTTPQAIFPDRRIGRLDADYKVSFLVLAGNPLDDFSAVRTIRERVKERHRIGSSHEALALPMRGGICCAWVL